MTVILGFMARLLSGSVSGIQACHPAKDTPWHAVLKPEVQLEHCSIKADSPHVCKPPAKHTFKLYRINGEPHTLVLFEHWTSVAAHETHLTPGHSRRLDAVLPAALANPTPNQKHFLVKALAARPIRHDRPFTPAFP
ncbi:hypothetical protein GRF61_15450 [Azoarcus sp. TTM-91]|uniref:putative quinol monooxygenase n=1 Tax=Azoarcus sp. TTM-91 TaxID=2691581 RepID=UPI00145F8090|nr:hypothetical protein [Azoarcus sp. TTM-91]NMG35842.1 hypothetical protein [Azoarcus sp. TTM-91]